MGKPTICIGENKDADMRKPAFGFLIEVGQKLACATTETDKKLDISDLVK